MVAALRCDQDIACRGHAESAPERRAVDRADYRDRTFHDRIESLASGARVGPLRTRTPRRGRAAPARFEVGARAKAFARTGQDSDAHLRQVVKGIEGRGQTFNQTLTHRIDGRPIHRNGRDMILDFNPNIGSVHGKSLCNRDACVLSLIRRRACTAAPRCHPTPLGALTATACRPFPPAPRCNW